MQRFQDGLVFKAHRLCVSLNSRRKSNKEEEEEDADETPPASLAYAGCYRGTSLIRNTPLLRPCRRTMPRAVWWSGGGGLFLMSEVPLYAITSRGENLY